MSKISQRRALLLAAIVPVVLVAGCSSAGNDTQAMKGAASPATPTDTGSMMPEETGTGTAAPTDMESASPTATDTGAAGGAGGQARAVVESYFSALKSGNVDQVVGAFADDAVVALDGEATAEGTQAIRTLFQQQLKGANEQAQATHTIDEARTAGSEDAIVSSTSKQGDETYRELFVLSKDGEWKISQFMNNQAS
ncbi:YybH family protein [Nonomuraea zeae]|uniref:Nuclear transport factor 2 family protein n=1 Tax=Nonomuraea zeae TaxID=1642303 RepID=A0A5S4GXM7_9ACTN|nr:nuclear transport factor 2 family protein [Nonomuraea zeae]TMR31240.1 nuclear transport factor 2 family protein [Nonomuraea zeae]